MKQQNERCEDAPCCGCCSADGSMMQGNYNGPVNWDEDDRDMTGQDGCDGSTPAADMPTHEY